ncbi:MAG: UPF0158 family protein [Candidatus Aminicenantes bacterium]
MKRPIKLSDIIDAMEFQPDETTAFLNKETGEIVGVSDEEFRAAEEKRSLESYPEWQRGLIREAAHILEDEKGRYIALPSRFDIHEYHMMERFALSVDDEFSAGLLAAIKGKGAFRRFKDGVRRFGIEEEWLKFRGAKFKELAVDWCGENEVEYLDDL